MLDSVFTSSTYNSYVPTAADMDAYMESLEGFYDISNWTALTSISSVSSIVVLSGVATATSENHGRSNGDIVLIEGANPSELDGSKTITVIDSNTFTYASASPDGTATGVITFSYSDDKTKENLILGATRDANMFDYVGALNNQVISPYDMKWPRSGAQYSNGVNIANNEIPAFIFDYLAKRIVEKQTQISDGSYYDGRVKREKLGELEREFHNPRDSRLLKKSLAKQESFQCIAPYVVNAGGNMRYVARA